MKRLIGLAVLVVVSAIFAAAVFAGGSEDSAGGGKMPTVVLAHGKVEIDEPFKAYAKAWGEKNGVNMVIKTVGGGGADLATELKASYAAGELPDIFSLAGVQEYLEWQKVLTDLSGEAWNKDTSVAFKYDGKVYGFPVAIEGWGMAYNAEILEKAGVDPAGLNSLEAYRMAFERIDAMKGDLGLDSVVSMAASAEMFWVTAHHNINSYLSNGLPYGDLSVANRMTEGNLDVQRFQEYADWVGLLFEYADKAVLTTGNYDAQVNAFATQKAAFLHQGNWVDPNMASANATFRMAYAPHGSTMKPVDGIFVSAPSYYFINNETKNMDMAKKFLNDLVYTDEGQKFMVEAAGMIPAFGNVKLKPTGQLSSSVQDWSAKGKVYSWNQYYLSNDFRNTVLAPIYNQFALGQIDKATFVQMFTDAVSEIDEYQE